jgi:hypothetical protein
MRNLAFVSRRYIRVEVGMHINKSIRIYAMAWAGWLCVYIWRGNTHAAHYILRCGWNGFGTTQYKEREKPLGGGDK